MSSYDSEGAGSDGEVVKAFPRAKAKRIVMDNSHKPTVTDLGVPYEKWILDEAAKEGVKMTVRDLKAFIQRIHNRTKRHFPSEAQAGADRRARDIAKYAREKYDPYEQMSIKEIQNAQEPASQVKSDHWSNKRSSTNIESAVPSKYRKTPISGVPEEFLEPEEVLPPPPKEIKSQPFPNKFYELAWDDDAWEPKPEKFELCKIVKCPNIVIKPRHVGKSPEGETNLLVGCCGVKEDDLKDKCPLEEPLTKTEQELYEGFVEDVGQESAFKAILKLKARYRETKKE